MLVIGGIRGGFDKALENTLAIANPLPRDYAENLQKRKWTMSYLYLTHSGPPLALVEQLNTDDPHVAWIALQNQHKPVNVKSFNEMAKDFESYELLTPESNPEPWMQELDCHNQRLAAISRAAITAAGAAVVGHTYTRNAVQMINQIINKLPKSRYQPFVTSMEIIRYSTINLQDFQYKLDSFGETI
jgi:hypothetical protein